MISNQILQTTVDGLKEISRVDLCVIDAEEQRPVGIPRADGVGSLRMR